MGMRRAVSGTPHKGFVGTSLYQNRIARSRCFELSLRCAAVSPSLNAPMFHPTGRDDNRSGGWDRAAEPQGMIYFQAVPWVELAVPAT